MLLDEVIEEVVEAPAELDEVGKILGAAAERIKQYGWTQYSFGNEALGYCALGAIHAVHNGRDCAPARIKLAIIIGHIKPNGLTAVMSWNDTKGRTKEEVVAALQAAARI